MSNERREDEEETVEMIVREYMISGEAVCRNISLVLLDKISVNERERIDHNTPARVEGTIQTVTESGEEVLVEGKLVGLTITLKQLED